MGSDAQTTLVLLKGINVGGHNVVKMAALRHALEAAGLADVRTYIQSGNILCREDPQALTLVRAVLRDVFDVDVPAVAVPLDHVQRVLQDHPFQDAAPNQVLFLWPIEGAGPVDVDGALVHRNTETLAWVKGVPVVHAPDGIGRSKFLDALPKHLPFAVTARNLNTMNKLQMMAGG